jgi:internalin A
MTDAELLAIIAQAEREGWTELDLSGNDLSELPAEIGKLSKLESLILGKGLKNYEFVGNLFLQQVSGNNFKTLPSELFHLPNLRKLDISGNPLEHIPDVVTQMLHLEELILIRAELTEIPASISNLANLKELYLYSNQITAIPDAIGKLVNLTTLDFRSNQITALPESLGKLVNLTTLDLRNNQITTIPDAITNLANLSKLDLSYNPINEIKNQVLLLPNLQKFYLEDDRLLNLAKLYAQKNNFAIAPEILVSGNEKGQKAFNYLRQLLLESSRPLHEAKLLLVGEGSVGKTSLMERLILDKYDKNQSQTDGLNVETWNVDINSKDIRLNVWDFGGQEIYHATHQFFLTKRSLYLLVCNCRTSEEKNRIEYWLKLIESFGGKSPVIIVGNKKDEQPLDINRKALREKYPNIQAIIETSCSKNEGIDELRAAILKQVGNLKEVYDLLPLSWFEVKQQLESMPEDFITYNRYLNICYENKIPEEQNQEQLIDLLHRLGLVLNFRDHPILKDTNVLKPNWVTEGIYALLSDETLKTKTKGIFTHADLTRILDPERYPIKRHSYLIELMKEFELGFELSCYPPQFLIAGLLPKDQPEETQLEGETLEFQYHYKVLPESIISRFIVITQDRIHNHTYWRSGVMLQYQEDNEIYNIARIKADPEDKKICIAISGRKETRRLFLGILRDTFKRIHNTLPNLEITEWVPVPNHPNHPPLDYQELLGLEAMGVLDYPIGKLKININIRQLLDGYEALEVRRKIQRKKLEPNDHLTIVNQIYNSNQHGDSQPMTDITNNNNQGANIGSLVNKVQDKAQVTVSNFTQTSGASVTELLQIINTLRQTAAQFPPDIREDITIDIDDVEAEIQKPEKERSLPKLKKRLLALLTAVSVIATPIAGITDFTNNVLEIGNKLHIELPFTPQA